MNSVLIIFFNHFRRLLNNAGVARFNTVSESLTHVIVGQREDEHWKQIEQLGHKPHVVTAEWVVQSLRLQRAAPESRFLHPDFKIAQQDVFKNPEKPAPLSASVTNGEQEADSQMMQQYLTNDESEAAGDQPSGIFSGLTFQFSRDMDSDLAQELGDQILKNGGSLVAKKANYLVIEVGSQLVSTGVQGQIVNTLWIDDCIEKEELVEVEAYHNQIIVKDPKRMENYTVSFTGIPRTYFYSRLSCFNWIFLTIFLFHSTHKGFHLQPDYSDEWKAPGNILSQRPRVQGSLQEYTFGLFGW